MTIFIICISYIFNLLKNNKIQDKNKAIRVIVLSAALIFGVAFFNATLLLNGRSMYNSNMYWIYHSDLIVITRLIQISALWIVIGYINSLNLKNLSFSWLILKIPIKMRYFLLAVTIFLAFTVIPLYTKLYNRLKTDRSNWYRTEKIYRFYSLLGKPAVLPANRIIDNSAPVFYHDQLYLSSPSYPMVWPGSYYVTHNYPMVYYRDFAYVANNFPKNYNFNQTNRYVPYILTNFSIAMQLFEDAGGTITVEEMDAPIFGKLFDEKFVLNTK